MSLEIIDKAKRNLLEDQQEWMMEGIRTDPKMLPVYIKNLKMIEKDGLHFISPLDVNRLARMLTFLEKLYDRLLNMSDDDFVEEARKANSLLNMILKYEKMINEILNNTKLDELPEGVSGNPMDLLGKFNNLRFEGENVDTKVTVTKEKKEFIDVQL